ncbi:IS200/IS605 family element transposase accessory protein TnpB [Rhizobium sp. MHM7A]|uniref:IS200/IS605 family element transposase accessory protein TnpB n=1 Tax=Rhizobium sp. MHM7A TaxID=2583233 RepID=UPI00110698E1|nr:IS200/IS605 family element transposase accessory protein TnpB [Rhizobium sp. MHM7A]TLX16469.1 IS200/IS605 family element transposase accessory protein TnpB [Rhizobium sp. MHM7A]
MIRTFETRIAAVDDRHADILGKIAEKMCVAERKIHAFLASGKEWKADEYRHIYTELGLSSVMFRSAKDSLDGRLRSISELAKVQAADLKLRVDQKKKQIEDKEDNLAKARVSLARHQVKFDDLSGRISELQEKIEAASKPSVKAKAVAKLKLLLDKRAIVVQKLKGLANDVDQMPFNLHQHRRKLSSLKCQLRRAEERTEKPRICFGAKNLFRQQFDLEANGFKSHAEWKETWRKARTSSFAFVGVANMAGGNEVARLKLRKDGLFNLELRLPPGIRTSSQSYITFRKISFNQGHDKIIAALARQQPLTVRFVRDEISWKIHVTIDQPTTPGKFDDSRGCLGIDLNADSVALTLVDRFGNPIRSWTIPMVTHGLSSDQALDLTRKVAKQIIDLAREYDVTIAAEDLDFATKKAQLTSDSSPRYARMLSSFGYSSFQRALASACARNAVYPRQVNPAFTSLIGRTKFARRYGLSVHTAAALSIARRAMGFSERMPKPIEGKIILPLDNGDHVTLPRPARIAGRHVWSQWRTLNVRYKAALAAHRRTRRKSRSSGMASGGPNPEELPLRRTNGPSPAGFVRDVPR